MPTRSAAPSIQPDTTSLTPEEEAWLAAAGRFVRMVVQDKDGASPDSGHRRAEDVDRAGQGSQRAEVAVMAHVQHREDGSFTVTWRDGSSWLYDRIVREDGTVYHRRRP